MHSYHAAFDQFWDQFRAILHVSGATHASLPVPLAHSAELDCRVDVSGCEWLQIDEKRFDSGRVLFSYYFQFQFEIGFIHLFIFSFNLKLNSFIHLLNWIGDLQEPCEILHFHKDL